MDRWAEYRDGTLTPPVVVQHDVIGTEHLYWVWTGTQIVGPLSRRDVTAGVAPDDETVLADVVRLADTAPGREVADPAEARIARLEAENADLRRQIADRRPVVDERQVQ